MSEAQAKRSPLYTVAERAALSPGMLAGAWLVLGACTFVYMLKTQSSVDSMPTGLMVMCMAMATPFLGPKLARAGGAMLALSLVGLYGAEQQGWLMAHPPEPMLGVAVGLAMLVLGVLQGRHFYWTRQVQVRQLREQEVQSRLSAEEAGRARSDFLSVMSHEVRTPLNGMVGLVSLIQDERVDAENRHQYLRMLEQSSQALSNLVTEWLDFSKIEAGRIELVHEPFSVRRWSHELERSFSAAATVKGLFLQFELDASVGEHAIGDAGRLRQLAAHFISNAIQTTKAGTIRVRISRPQGDERLRLEVRDSGIGLTDAAQQQLFKPFQQPGARVQREFGGVGWGLSLCERLAQGMGGTAGVHGLPGAGSTLWAEVELPVMVRDASQGAPLVTPDDQPMASPEPPLQTVQESGHLGQRNPLGAFDLDAARVLVVDDNAGNRTITSQMLRRMNAIVATANDGQEGLDAMRAAHAEGWPFDLVLMDVQMPRMDGLTAVGLLRADPLLQHTPVVALTAGVLKEDVARAIEAGMDGFLAKPITAERLGRNVAHFASRRRQGLGSAQELKF